MTGYLDKLNAEQRRAVVYGVEVPADGPLLVIAGAGSGKTNTLAHRVAHLVVNGADPRRILLLTFSRRAAAEMIRRVERITAAALRSRAAEAAVAIPWSGTFHSVGARLLRIYAEQIGLGRAFTIHDREDAADLLNLVRHERGLSGTERRFPAKGTCLSIYSRVVNSQGDLAQVLGRAFPWCAAWAEELRTLFAAYVEAKQRQDVLDYDDLLLYWGQMAAEPTIAADIAARFDHVLVDEYQDTNRLQAAILKSLKPDGRGLTVVGDDAQSIYAFRAATVRNILDFPKEFERPAQVITLDRNYRSTQPILDASNAVIALAAERFTKNLWTDRAGSRAPQLVTVADEIEQARCVVERILRNREAGIALKSQAVLFRTSHHSSVLEVELTRRDIPFVKFGGLKFLDSAHVKDVLACLRLMENPKDRVAGFRTLQLIPGIGPATAGRLLDALADRAAITAIATLPAPRGTAEDWQDFVNLAEQLAGNGCGWPAEFGAVRAWYQPHLERLHEDAAIRAADLAQLEQIAAGYPSRERFLTELTLDPPDAVSDEAGVPTLDDDYLILSTIHSAKGQEWTSVFVLNTVDGCIPSDLGTGSSEEIEEERRLLYVAMTRAKDELTLMVPQRFYTHQQSKTGDRHLYAMRTRFIPPGLLKRFETRLWPEPRPHDAAARPTALPQVDLRARVKGMWR